ncbi:MAG: hypothetical protein K6G50_10625 [bacterium]|nr:hypothetical protein [bacterium]
MQNIYRFSTLTAIACLGLGLMTAGCADGGGGTTYYPFSPAPAPSPTPEPTPEPSPSPSPEPSEKASLKLEFGLATAKAEVPLEVVAYNFLLNIGDTESQAEEGIEKKADDDNPGLQTVTIEGIDPAVDNVAVEYLDKDGKTIAISEFPVELAAGQETVADDFSCLEASALIIAGSADYVNIGEDISLTPSVIYGDEYSEDAIEREVSNDDVTYELKLPEQLPEDYQFEHCFEAKAGENGTFTSKERGNDFAKATYTENISGSYVLTAITQGAKLNDKYTLASSILVPIPRKHIVLLNPSEPLPDNFSELGVEMLFISSLFVQGINEADFYCVRTAETDEGDSTVITYIPVQAQWCGSGDYFQVASRGQKGHISLAGVGTSGSISATVTDGEAVTDVTMPVAAVDAKTVTMPAKKIVLETGDEPLELYTGVEEAELEPGQELQLYPAGLYAYTDPLEENDPDSVFGPFIAKDDDNISWSMADGSADSITVENGLVKASATAQNDDQGNAGFTVKDFAPDMTSSTHITVKVPQD